MARKLQFADRLKEYEEPTAENTEAEAAHKTQVKVSGFEEAADRAGEVRKKGRQGKKSPK